VGGMDTCARALKAAAACLADGSLEAARRDRYAGWETPAAKAMLAGGLEAAAARVTAEGLEPKPKSGRQERLENLWNRFI
jgi:xylose isomerase